LSKTQVPPQPRLAPTTHDAGKEALRAFISYSHSDAKAVQHLLRHVSPNVSHELRVSFDSDHAVTAGSTWNDEIANAIAQSSIFILCMSAQYLNSRFLYYQELPAIRQRLNIGNSLIIPVILSPCAWWGFVGDIQVSPVRNGRVKPITEWTPQEKGYQAAADQIMEAIRFHLGLTVKTKGQTAAPRSFSARRLGPVTLPGPHRLSPDAIDRAVETLIRSPGKEE
jgi:hypothetical protein